MLRKDGKPSLIARNPDFGIKIGRNIYSQVLPNTVYAAAVTPRSMLRVMAVLLPRIKERLYVRIAKQSGVRIWEITY